MVHPIPLRFKNQDARLAGTLYRPDGAAWPPVVVGLHAAGSGLGSDPLYRHLIEHLPAAGFAVCLYDRRGSGRSSGSFETADFELLAGDAQAAIAALDQEAVDTRRVFLYGISQGGWIAPLVARRVRHVDGLVIVSGSGVSPAEQMAYAAEFALRRAGFGPEIITRALELGARVNNYYRGRLEREAVQAELDRAAGETWFPLAYLDPELPRDVRADKWFYEMDYDPLPVWAELRRPALFVYAEEDEWVPVEESLRRYRAATAHLPSAAFRRIPASDHFMAPPGALPGSGAVSEEYVRVLLAWLRSQL